MIVSRREFVSLASVAAGTLASVTSVLGADSSLRSQIKAIAFDAFVIFDPRPAFAIAEELFPRNGTLVGEDGLLFAANKLKLELSPEKLDRLMNAYLELNAWPDVVSTLISLRKTGFRLALLSNFTRTMLEANIKRARLDGFFDHVLSTDQARTYKPDPRAYQLGIDALKLTREEILFAAFAGWDAAGAKLFGFPTFWVNRQKLPPEERGFQLAQSWYESCRFTRREGEGIRGSSAKGLSNMLRTKCAKESRWDLHSPKN